MHVNMHCPNDLEVNLVGKWPQPLPTDLDGVPLDWNVILSLGNVSACVQQLNFCLYVKKEGASV